MISVYDKLTQIELGPRKIELLDKYSDIIQMGRRNPVWFIEKFLDIQLLDYQKWMIMSAWTKSKVCFVCSRNTGKSFIAGVYIMTRAILFPSMKIWIAANTAKQSLATFSKVEDLAKHNIKSVHNNKCIFWQELKRANSQNDGFKHGDSSQCRLFNDSEIKTLVGGDGTNVIGMRSNLTIFDEAGVITKDFFDRVEPFTTQDSSFATGVGVNLSILPLELPNQTLYLSSAADTSSHLWIKYKDCAMRMMMGYDDCFVADIGCEIPLNPTINGEKYPPLFNRSEVESMMRSNPYRALREYYNIFDQSGGNDTVVGRDTVLRNTYGYLPVFKNRREDAIYGIFYDPAHQADNSFVLICEYVKDKVKGWTMRIINGINLLQTLPNGDKKPMRSNEQLEWIRQLMLDYNGQFDEYSKIHLAIDPGAGGGGLMYADFLLNEWKDHEDRFHHGVICRDCDDYEVQKDKFPRAIEDVLYLPTSQKFKNEQYAALQELVQQDLIFFPPSVPMSGDLELDDGKKIVLTSEEQRALIEIDLLKEEAYMMRKVKTELGNIRYTLPPDKIKTAHDDRAYTLSMAQHYLMELRRADQYDVNSPLPDYSRLMSNIGSHGRQSLATNPFAGNKNPWAGRR